MVTAGRVSLAAALLLAGCTSSSISTVAPSGSKCQVSATNAPASYTATGGSGTLSISAERDCTWSVSASAGWISIQGPSTGQGEATVPYAVQANPAPAPRSGSIVVSSDTLTVSQAAAPCTFSLASTRGSIGAAGGSLSVPVSTLTGCTWNASSTVPWISIPSGASGSGSGTAVLAVAANDGTSRVGSVNVAGQNYTVSQDAKPAPAPTPAPAPSPSPSPTPAPSPAPSPTPPPAPTPPPTPTPPPPPPPPPGPSTVELTGSVDTVTGACPAVTFTLESKTIVTDAGTKYSHGDCGDIRHGVVLTVTGTTKDGTTVLADSISFSKD